MLGKVKIGAVILAYDVDPFIARVIGELLDIVDKVYVVDDCKMVLATGLSYPFQRD